MAITRKQSEIDKEIDEMKEIIHISESTWTVLKSVWLRPVLVIGCIFALLQQIIGINAIIYYAPTIFSKAGLGDATAILGTVGIGSVNVIVTIFAIYIMDKIDRKNYSLQVISVWFVHYLLWQHSFGQSDYIQQSAHGLLSHV